MRNRLMIAMVALLMLIPASAFAQEAVDCYTNPDDPACSDVLDEEEEVTEEEEEVAEEEIEEVSVEVLNTSETDGELAETGVSATLFSVIAALMLAAGVLLLVVSRRRGSTV